MDDVAKFISAFSGNHRYILDYLMEEVLNRQTEAVRLFLLKTSVLDQLCGSLCNSVALMNDGQSHSPSLVAIVHCFQEGMPTANKR